MDSTQTTPEMDQLVDSLLKGERFLLFAPGIWSFVGAGGTTTLGITFLVTALGPRMASDYSVPARGISGMVGVALGATIASACSVLLVNGYAVGHRIWSGATAVGAVLAVLTLALTWGNGEPIDRLACPIAVVMLALGALLVRTNGFALFVLFRQRLKARREVFLEQLRSGKIRSR